MTYVVFKNNDIIYCGLLLEDGSIFCENNDILIVNLSRLKIIEAGTKQFIKEKFPEYFI